jgi:hypothetical protein
MIEASNRSIAAMTFSRFARLRAKARNVSIGHFGQQTKPDAKGAEGCEGDLGRGGALSVQNLRGVRLADADRSRKGFG